MTDRHLLLPNDGSKLSEEAAAAGIALAKALGARVTALHVLPEPATCGLEVWVHGDEEFEERLDQAFEAHGKAYLESVRKIAVKAGVPCECALVRGEAPHAEIIIEARDRGCDLIVMASHGRKGPDAVLLASETLKVMTLGALPVLVHRSPSR